MKAMSNLSRVRSPGDAPGILKGEYQPTSQVRAVNAQLQRAGKKPAKYSPIIKGVDVMPRVVHDDWMAKLNYNRLTKTLTDAAAEGSVSDLHGLHPIPGIANPGDSLRGRVRNDEEASRVQSTPPSRNARVVLLRCQP